MLQEDGHPQPELALWMGSIAPFLSLTPLVLLGHLSLEKYKGFNHHLRKKSEPPARDKLPIKGALSFICVMVYFCTITTRITHSKSA